MLRDEIQRADQRIFWREALRSRRVILQLLALTVSTGLAATPSEAYGKILVGLGLYTVCLGTHAFLAHRTAKTRRFINARFANLWNGCRERFESFEEGIHKLKRAEIAQFQELPNTVQDIGLNLYNALRRADILFEEVIQSEGVERIQPDMPYTPPTDPQAVELYRIAEKNLSEYRSNYGELMGGIQRAEAQAVVYMTTLDNLRVKMLGYRLIGKNPSMSSQEFLSAMAEARAQLSAIDRALDELDLSHYPKTISVVPNFPETAVANTEAEHHQTHL